MYLPTRTSDTSAKPSAARPCRTVMPCGSLTTGLGVTMTRAITCALLECRPSHQRAPRDPVPVPALERSSSLVPRLGREQRLAHQHLVGGEVALARLGHDLGRQGGRVRFLVPPGV